MSVGNFPDSDFFWGIAFTVNPFWSGEFFDESNKIREMNPKRLLPAKVINISQNWKNKLIIHNFTSKCKYIFEIIFKISYI